MAKSKNHTGQHESKKNHRNGIKKPVIHRKKSTKGVYQKWRTNTKYARKGSMKKVAELRAAKSQ